MLMPRSGYNISITRFISNFKERLRNRSAQHHMDPGATGAVCASDSWTTSKQCIVHVLGAVRCGVSGTVEIEPSLRRAGVDMELCLAQRDDRKRI